MAKSTGNEVLEICNTIVYAQCYCYMQIEILITNSKPCFLEYIFGVCKFILIYNSSIAKVHCDKCVGHDNLSKTTIMVELENVFIKLGA